MPRRGRLGQLRDEEQPAVRVIVPPDFNGPLFSDDPDPGDIVFDDDHTPMLVFEHHAEHGQGWVLSYPEGPAPDAGIEDHFIPGSLADIEFALSSARAWLRRRDSQ